MRLEHRVVLGVLIAVLLATSVSAEEKVYWNVVQKIMEEAFENSQAMDNASWLSDVYGPRNAKSPSYMAAANWAKNKLVQYGLPNARLEPYEFRTGYVYEYISVHMMAPQYMPIIAYPAPWSAGTGGKVRGNVVYINFEDVASEADLEQYRGKLKNSIIFTRPIQKLSPHFEPMATEFTDEQLDEMAKIPVGPRVPEERRGRRSRRSGRERLSRQQIIEFVFGEGALAIVGTDGKSDFGTVTVGISGYIHDTRPWEENAPPNPTELIMAAEHYNRIMRILEKDIPVELELDIKVSFTRDDPNDYNVVAEIPGTDLADEIVLFGGHLQANPAGTGATDNAAGVVVCMEVARIFKQLGLKPRRTVRIGLWGGHEMGLFGNRSHVRNNFADLEKKEYKPDYHNLSAYFNVDHGNGKIRAVSVAGNEVVRSIFTEWMKPLHSLGMSHLLTTKMPIGGNPGLHEAYSEVGLPGYYFYQDRIDMETQAHTNMDVYDRLIEENLMTNTVILATFVYHTAMRDEKLPRIAPLPW